MSTRVIQDYIQQLLGEQEMLNSGPGRARRGTIARMQEKDREREAARALAAERAARYTYTDEHGEEQTSDPFKLYPDLGDTDPSVHRARDARDRGLKNLEKRKASKIPEESLVNRLRPGEDTHILMFPTSNRALTTAETEKRIESGKMIPTWSRNFNKNKGRPRDEYGFTDIKKP